MTQQPAECDRDAVITVALSRSAGGPLVLTGECPGAEGIWWNALTLPAFAMRNTYAPNSQWVPGGVLLAAVPDTSVLPLSVGVRGSTVAGLETQKAILEAAVRQWSYTVTVVQDDVQIGSWAAMPTLPAWGDLTPQSGGLLAVSTALTIPVNPTGAP